MRILLFFSIVAMVTSASFLFIVKHEVIVLERTIAQTSAKIMQVNQENETLKSELSYLTNPQRIYELVQHHMAHLHPLKKEQLVPSSYLNLKKE